MGSTTFSVVHDALVAACNQWPRGAWSDSEAAGMALTARIARAVGSDEVQHCIATVDRKAAPGSDVYAAAIFTKDFVVAGSLTAPAEIQDTNAVPADVHVVPRSAIRSLTIHHAEQIDPQSEADIVVFTVEYHGMPDLKTIERSPAQYDGTAGALFDALRADLAAAGRR